MGDDNLILERFEDHRSHLRSVAYRMLGSVSEADDAVQEAWLRVSRADTSDVENERGWLTTVVARVCLNILRARTRRREDTVGAHVPDPIVTSPDATGPEQDALLADSVGLALLVVLETLGPAERLAFVLHDIFAVPFEEIAPLVGRTPTAARQFASRARRRVQGARAVPDADLARQREMVDAFFAAARGGDFDALVALLDPDVVVRSDLGTRASSVVRGAAEVAGQAMRYAGRGATLRPVLVNGAAGVVVERAGRPAAVIGFTIAGERIVAIDALSDPKRLRTLDVSGLD